MRLRVQDVLLTVMFAALITLAHDNSERALLALLTVLQLIEGRIPFLTTIAGRAVSVVLQLVLGYLLIGITNGVESPYYLVLLLPLVSTATYLGVTGTVASSVAAAAAYLSFLLFINWKEFDVSDEAFHVLAIRCLMPA